MKIAIASDHAGYEMKMIILGYLQAMDHDVMDLGTDSTESVDYPVYGKSCGQAVARKKAEKGIVICGSGIGISIAANKVKGVRCGLCTSVEMAELARKHNDANVLALGGRLTEITVALQIVDAFLNTEFEGGRHQKRVDLLDQ